MPRESCSLPSSSPDDVIRQVLSFKTIAVVGCSPKPERAGHYVPAYMQSRGYKIVPVNPGHDEILGEKCFASLSQIPFPVELVNVFRRSEDVPPVIDEAIKIKAKGVWLQSGIANPEAEEKARAAGLLVVSDECLMVRHRQLRG